jgi:transposase
MELYDQGHETAEVCEMMGCCPAWARRLKQRRRERGTLEPRKPKRPDQRTYDEADEQKIRQLIQQKPDATLAEVVAALGKPAHLCTASRTLERLGLPRKKSPAMPASRTGRT